MPVDPEKLLALYIYSNNDEVQVLLKTLKSNSGFTYRNLLRQMIEEVSGSERLRKRVRAFYAEFGGTWKDTGDQTNTDDRTFIRIGQSEETLALASALAFQLCGSGSLSELGRLLIRFYASEGRRVVFREPTRENDQPKDKVVPIRAPRQSGPWHVTTINLDEETKTLLTLLTYKLHMKGNGLVAHLVEKYAGTRGRQMDMLREAVRWEHELPVQNPAVRKRFNFTQQTLSLLEHLGYKLIAGTNASLIIRALIRTEAAHQELSVSRKRLRMITK